MRHCQDGPSLLAAVQPRNKAEMAGGVIRPQEVGGPALY